MERKSTFISLMLLILISAIVLSKTLKPQRYERLLEKWAGIWIKNQSGRGVIFTTMPRIAYYAEGSYVYIDLKKDTIKKINVSMQEKEAFYLALRERDAFYLFEGELLTKKKFIEVKRYEEKGIEKIVLYKRVQ